MVTEADKKLAESMRSLGRATFDLANEIDPPIPHDPCRGCQYSWGGCTTDPKSGELISRHCSDNCEELDNYRIAMAKWKIKQEE